jgi:hypothetical protein
MWTRNIQCHEVNLPSEIAQHVLILVDACRMDDPKHQRGSLVDDHDQKHTGVDLEHCRAMQQKGQNSSCWNSPAQKGA